MRQRRPRHDLWGGLRYPVTPSQGRRSGKNPLETSIAAYKRASLGIQSPHGGDSAMLKILRGVVDWAGRATTIQTIIQSQFLQTWFWPMLSGLIVIASGILQREPVMWALMAGMIAFAAVTVGMLAVIALRVQTSPQNKLLNKVVLHHDLTPREAPLLGTRQQRRAHDRESRQMLSSSQIVPNVNRTLDKVQLGVELTNNSYFPISVILERAETQVEGETPPRSTFPKPPTTIQPGASIRLMDDAIPMEETPCQHLGGQIDMMIKYGRKGNEKFELSVKGAVRIEMESNGFASFIQLSDSGTI